MAPKYGFDVRYGLGASDRAKGIHRPEEARARQMNGATVRHNRLSLSAVAMMVVLGLFTLLFVDTVAGVLIIVLGVIMYVILVWLTTRFSRSADSGASRGD